MNQSSIACPTLKITCLIRVGDIDQGSNTSKVEKSETYLGFGFDGAPLTGQGI